MTTLTEKIIEVLPMEKAHHEFECGGTKKYEDWCDDMNCPNAKSEVGFNTCRAEVIELIPKILEIVREEIKDMKREPVSALYEGHREMNIEIAQHNETINDVLSLLK